MSRRQEKRQAGWERSSRSRSVPVTSGRGRRFGLRRRLAGSFGLVAVLAVVLTVFLTFQAGWRAVIQLDPQLAALAVQSGASGPPTGLDETLGGAQGETLKQILRSFGRSAWQAGLLASLLAAVASALVARQIARPLVRLEDAASRLAGGERGVRLPLPRSNDELRTVTAAFNTLAQGLERQEAWRRSLMADVAHDLRTPLAVLRAEIEAIQDGLNEPDAPALVRLHAEVLLLARLVDDLRLLSLAEGGALTLHPQPVDAALTLQTLASLFAGRVTAAGAALKLDAPPGPLFLRADPDRLMQILHNLLDNALRYGVPTRGDLFQIDLGAAREQGQVRLWVRDHGPGFAPDALSRAFERFYRADASRSRDPQGVAGSGLGLAIARALAEAQGGTLEAMNHPQGGAVFTLKLPEG
ncbi:ATP-binding protein (plasmid) [Deinococcus radiomollis]|uniref:ATP-binding protein n=1 Tax=Deinococcus radiomollis TaxID=468916 RepID=UPI0038915307